jgi:DNA repair protein RecN (Recombination protein N)
MSLKRIALRDFVIVRELELDLADGFSVLTGETGAGKSILVDALQLALGARAEAGVVREGASRGRDQRRIRPAAGAGAVAAGSRLRRRRHAAAAPHHRQPGQEPRLDQRQRRHRHAAARSGRAAGRHPRPARLAKPHPAGRRARLLDGYAGTSTGKLQQLWQAGARRRRRWPRPAPRRIRCSANASAWPGRSAKSTSWRPAPTSGTS